MQCVRLRFGVLLVSCCVLVVAASSWSARCANAAGLPPETRNDAQLHDVTFVDTRLGWAVGDRGVIWHTEDGGRHWYRQQTPVRERLESVCFLDAQRGWAVGGGAEPYTHRTAGYVLRTQNGGTSWTQVSGITMPWLKHVQFQDAVHGWALGGTSAMYPTGIFRTDDGGRSWTPIPSGVHGNWLTGDFWDVQHGVTAGREGLLATISAPRVRTSETPSLGARSLRALRMTSRRSGWLVGDGGLVLRTDDGGRTWQTPPGALPAGVAELFDFYCLAVHGTDLWIAGAPGTRILHSSDQGVSWELLSTGQNAPLRALAFADDQYGWAVGDLGTILGTTDGGKSWQVQRCGGKRLALLVLVSTPRRIPFDLLALQSGNDGYLAGVELIGQHASGPAATVAPPAEDLAAQAVAVVGACCAAQAWQFPLRQAGLELPLQTIVNDWNRANDGRAISVLEQRIVRLIRQWQPDVIVTERPSDNPRGALAQVVNQVVLTAVHAAADPTMYPDHLTVAHLKPWTVKKVFSDAPSQRQATVPLTTAQLAPRLGCSVADQAALGQAIVFDDAGIRPMQIGYRLLTSNLPHAADHQDLFGGIHLPPGSDARRPLGLLQNDLKTLRRITQKHRNLQQLIARADDLPMAATGWLGEVTQMTRGLPTPIAAQVLYQLGARYRDSGRTELAAQTFEQLLERFPDSRWNDAAISWLIQYYASGEVSWQLQRRTHFSSQVTWATAPVRNNGKVDAPAGADHSSPEVVRASFESRGKQTTAAVGVTSETRAGKALIVGKRLQRTVPQLFAEPGIQFPMSVAYRIKGMPRDADRFYHRLAALPSSSPWAACAQAELWLAHGRGVAPKPIYTCRLKAPRPYLDGKLDDATWQNASVLELKSPYHDDGDWPAAVMLAGDDQFLFLAVCCRKAPGHQYPTSQGKRTRDPDLADSDRVALLLDVDRDYRSYYRLTVDSRGWTGEACNGNTHFDPKWYVAATQSDQEWTVEAAIPWAELVPNSPTTHDAWAFGVQRVVPGVGMQSFAQPAAIKPLGQGFALLMFK